MKKMVMASLSCCLIVYLICMINASTVSAQLCRFVCYIEKKKVGLKNRIDVKDQRIFCPERISSLILQGCPSWMTEQISGDLSYFQENPVKLSALEEFFKERSAELHLVKFVIKNNEVSLEKYFSPNRGLQHRIESFKEALLFLSSCLILPDTTFFLSIEDGLVIDEKLPLWVMSKQRGSAYIVLPDFEALRANYQVLKNQDITQKVPISWAEKQDQLIWRGSTAQMALDGSGNWLYPHNKHLFSRVTLCELAEKMPRDVNAKFTIYCQGAELMPALQQLHGEWVSYEDQLRYKYHLLIDGNASSYTASGWKFFSNSLVFKPDSTWTQWYYGALIPYVHYLPVRADLTDLTEKIKWARNHDQEAQKIAQQAREFALQHITFESNLIYLYFLLKSWVNTPGYYCDSQVVF